MGKVGPVQICVISQISGLVGRGSSARARAGRALVPPHIEAGLNDQAELDPEQPQAPQERDHKAENARKASTAKAARLGVKAAPRARGRDCGIEGPNPDARYGRWCAENFCTQQRDTLFDYRRLWEVFGEQREALSKSRRLADCA